MLKYKRYDNAIGYKQQQMIDNDLPVCPFCESNPHWLLHYKIKSSSIEYEFMCEKCKGKLFIESHGVSTLENLRVTDIGKYNKYNLVLNSIYHVSTLNNIDNMLNRPINISFKTDNKPNRNINNDYQIRPSRRIKSKTIAFLIGGLVTFIMLISFIVWIFSKNVYDGPLEKDLVPVTESRMYVVNTGYGYYSFSITGSCQNTSSENMSYVSITFTLYDRDGNDVGTALANEIDLPAGDTWSYTATGLIFGNNEPVNWKSTEVTVIGD